MHQNISASALMLWLMTMKEYKMKIALQIVGSLLIIGLIGWYTVHTWSDCLEENSVITCMRMLNK